MKYSKIIALSAISSALCLILLVLGAFVEVFDLSCLFLASIVIMIPLSKGYALGAFLSYMASGLLGLLLTGKFQIIIPFAMFFGLHPIVNFLQEKYKINKILALVVKAAWFIGTLFVTYYFTTLFVVETEWIKQYIVPIILMGGAAFFVFYDFFMFKFQEGVNNIVKRLKL